MWKKGQNYLIRTVTHHLVGELVEVTDHELWLQGASWVPDDGRFHDCLRDGDVRENEPGGGGLTAVGRGALIDAWEWNHALLDKQK